MSTPLMQTPASSDEVARPFRLAGSPQDCRGTPSLTIRAPSGASLRKLDNERRKKSHEGDHDAPVARGDQSNVVDLFGARRAPAAHPRVAAGKGYGRRYDLS